MKQVKKVNAAYLLGYIFLPLIVTLLCFWLGYTFFYGGGAMAAVLMMGPGLLSVLWWIFGGNLIYKQRKKKLERELDGSGFVRNQTFYGDGCTVVVDMGSGKIALIFFWNPFESYVLPASRVGETWVDDGRGGKGFMEGSSRVSFLFMVDSVKIRVNTFTSNKRWRMDSNYILTGISKADMMVEVLETAKRNSN